MGKLVPSFTLIKHNIMDIAISIKKEVTSSDTMFGPVYILVLSLLVVMMCYLAYLCDARLRGLGRGREYCRGCEDDIPPSYHTLFLAQPPPAYETVGHPPSYGSIA